MTDLIYHKHRIIPGHMGGTYAPENVVLLTIEEHAEAHRLLYEEHGRWQDKVAWKALSGQIGQDEILREVLSAPKSEEHCANLSAANKGKKKPPRTEEHKAAISVAKKGKKRGPASAETKARMSAAHKGKKRSAEHRANLSAANKGKKRSPEAIAKTAAANKGRKLSPESIAKRTATRKKNREEKKKP